MSTQHSYAQVSPLWRATLVAALFLAGAAGASSAQEPASQPAVDEAAVPSDPQRLSDLFALIEGPNSLQARRTGVRELLRLGSPEAAPRLAGILSGSDGAAKIAVASVLSGLPQYLDAAYAEAFLGMLADAEQEVRRAGGQALAAYRDGGVIPRLRALLLDAQQPLRVRLAVIETLGLVTQREAVGVLIEALDDPRGPICQPALTALEQATALSFDGDLGAARAWWEQNRNVPPAEWQRVQIERLVSQNRAQLGRSHALELRLVKALRDTYLRTPEAERSALLISYLSDTEPVVRRLGLDVVQAHQAEGKTFPDEALAEVRKLLADGDATVRALAVRTVASFRDVGDAERFTQMLSAEGHEQVRQALINGLGYVGTAASTVPLLALLSQEPDGASANEAVTALGRLAERGVLDATQRQAVATALLAKYRAAQRDDIAARERLLWAMSRVGDPRCGRAFVGALAPGEAVTVRQAAVQGIAVLADPPAALAADAGGQPASAPATDEADRPLPPQALADALVPAARDGDGGVRKTAVETLAVLAVSDAHLEALWGRLPTDQESDESIRELAWRGALRVLGGRAAGEVESWLVRLPENGNLKARRELELLQVAEQTLAAQPESRAELGRIRARIAGQWAAMGQVDDALATYVKALEDLHAGGSPETPRVAVELLRVALLSGRYNGQVSAALGAGNPPLDGKQLWEGIRSEIEKRVHPDTADQAIAMLAALQAHPPTSMPADVAGAIEQLLQRARELKAGPPASQPTSAPAADTGG